MPMLDKSLKWVRQGSICGRCRTRRWCRWSPPSGLTPGLLVGGDGHETSPFVRAAVHAAKTSLVRELTAANVTVPAALYSFLIVVHDLMGVQASEAQCRSFDSSDSFHCASQRTIMTKCIAFGGWC